MSNRILEIPENKLVSGIEYELSCWYYSNNAEELFNILKIQQKGPDSLITIQSRNTNSMPNTDGKKTIARMEFNISDVTKKTIISIESTDKLTKNKFSLKNVLIRSKTTNVFVIQTNENGKDSTLILNNFIISEHDR